MICIQDMYEERVSDVMREHDKSKPLFMYIPMQNVHTPLQVPQGYIDMYPNETGARQKYLALVTSMDDYVAHIVQELKNNGLYDNSIIIFSSDNGGAPGHAGASNYPLKGWKSTLYEGGIRVPGWIHSPKYVKEPGLVCIYTNNYPTYLKKKCLISTFNPTICKSSCSK